MTRLQHCLLGLIGLYQRVKPALDVLLLSVFGIVFTCKHTPSCSEFTKDQIRLHGTIRGSIAGFHRIRNCR